MYLGAILVCFHCARATQMYLVKQVIMHADNCNHFCSQLKNTQQNRSWLKEHNFLIFKINHYFQFNY